MTSLFPPDVTRLTLFEFEARHADLWRDLIVHVYRVVHGAGQSDRVTVGTLANTDRMVRRLVARGAIELGEDPAGAPVVSVVNPSATLPGDEQAYLRAAADFVTRRATAFSITLPDGATPLTPQQFEQRFPLGMVDLALHVAGKLHAAYFGGTTDPDVVKRYIWQATSPGVLQVAQFATLRGEPVVFSAPAGQLTEDGQQMVNALISYFDTSGSFDATSGSLEFSEDVARVGRIAKQFLDHPLGQGSTQAQALAMAYAADQLGLTVETLLDGFVSWRTAHPDVDAGEYFDVLVPPERRADIGAGYKAFGAEVHRFHELREGPSLKSDATLDQWLTEEYPDAIKTIAADANLSRRVVEEILRRWAGAGVWTFVRVPYGKEQRIAGVLTEGWPEFTSRSERAVQRVLMDRFNVRPLVDLEIAAPEGVSPQAATTLPGGVHALPATRGNRPGAYTYMRAIEAQYGVLTDMLYAASVARREGRTHFEGMSVRELFEYDIDALKIADTVCWFEEPILAVEAASSTLPDTVRLTRDLTSGFAGWWYFTLPQDVKTIPTDELVQALLWTWHESEVRFSTYVVADPLANGKPPLPSGIFPTSRFQWQEGETLAHVLKRSRAEHVLRYGKGGSFERLGGHPSQLTGTEETLTAIDRLLRFFVSGCLWMQQTILTTATGHVERHVRKRMERPEGFGRPLSDVQIIELRRRESVTPEPVPGHEARDWSCRWVVRGFWRNQYYPSKGHYQPKWIDSYVKGPADKPLKVPTHRVYAVSR